LAFGNVAEACIGVWIMRFVVRIRRHWGFFEILAGIGLVTLLAPIAGATIGSVTLAFVHHLPAAQWPALWLRWWTNDLLGLLIIAPAAIPLLGSAQEHWRDWTRARLIRVAAMMGAAAVVSAALLLRGPIPGVLFILFPALLVLAAWTDEAAAGLAASVIAAVTVLATGTGRWPFAEADPEAAVYTAMFF